MLRADLDNVPINQPHSFPDPLDAYGRDYPLIKWGLPISCNLDRDTLVHRYDNWAK